MSPSGPGSAPPGVGSGGPPGPPAASRHGFCYPLDWLGMFLQHLPCDPDPGVILLLVRRNRPFPASSQRPLPCSTCRVLCPRPALSLRAPPPQATNAHFLWSFCHDGSAHVFVLTWDGAGPVGVRKCVLKGGGFDARARVGVRTRGRGPGLMVQEPQERFTVSGDKCQPFLALTGEGRR